MKSFTVKENHINSVVSEIICYIQKKTTLYYLILYIIGLGLVAMPIVKGGGRWMLEKQYYDIINIKKNVQVNYFNL